MAKMRMKERRSDSKDKDLTMEANPSFQILSEGSDEDEDSNEQTHQTVKSLKSAGSNKSAKTVKRSKPIQKREKSAQKVKRLGSRDKKQDRGSPEK